MGKKVKSILLTCTAFIKDVTVVTLGTGGVEGERRAIAQISYKVGCKSKTDYGSTVASKFALD